MLYSMNGFVTIVLNPQPMEQAIWHSYIFVMLLNKIYTYNTEAK